MKWYPVSDELIEAVAEELEATDLEAKNWVAEEIDVKNLRSMALQPRKLGTDTLHGCRLSEHAAMRLRQRGLSVEDVGYIVRNGVCEQMANATIYYLRTIDIPGDERLTHQRLVGTAVITASDRSYIITIWRNRKHGLRNLRHKRGRHWRSPQELADKAA